MDICCIEECSENSVRPVLAAPRCAVEPVAYYPCLPPCTKTVYCCEKPKLKHHHHHEDSHRSDSHRSDSHRSDSHRGDSHYGQHSHHKIERRSYSPTNNHQDCCYIRPPSPHPACCAPEPSCCAPEPSCCKPVKTKYIIPCYRYEDGRIVRQLPVTAFKRNGMQDQEHGKVQGATNFLRRCSRDVELECDVCPKQLKICDLAKVPLCDGKESVCCKLIKKKPIKANQPTVLMRRACEVAVGNRPRKKPYVETRFIQDADHQESRYIREDEEGNCCFHFENQKTRCRSLPVGQGASCPQFCMEYPPCMTGRPAAPPRDCYYCNPC